MALAASVRRVLVVALVAAFALVTVRVGAGAATSELREAVLTNPALPDGVAALGRGRIPQVGGRSYQLYAARYTNAPWVLVTDQASGETAHVALPAGTTGSSSWNLADIAVAGSDVWVLSGGGPVYLRHYRLSGSPMPTTAALVSERVLGDTDSRASSVVGLASGAAVGVWHQQGATSPQALHVVHATPSDALHVTSISGLSTRSSTQALEQHPADGSVWVFSSADAGSTISAARLTESSSGLMLDRFHETFISSNNGVFAPDPEAPDLEVARDLATNTLALAYQSADRVVFSINPWVVGSRPAVARIAAVGSLTFTAGPDYTERITAIGLTVRAGDTFLTYRPVKSDLSFDTVQVSRYNGSGWDAPSVVGRLGDPRSMVYFGVSQVRSGGPLIDNTVRFLTDAPAWSSGGTTTTTTTAPSSDSTTPTTVKTKGGGGGGGGGGKRR